MRLQNTISSYGGFRWRIILDDKQLSTNYIERTKGVFFVEGNYCCLKCMKKVGWNNIWINDSRTKNKCECGQIQTLEIINCDDVALLQKV